MKTICLLLCLALSYTAGYIFPKQRYGDLEKLMVQPLNYIKQNQAYQQVWKQQQQEPQNQQGQNQQNQQQKLRLQTSQELNKQQQLTNKRPVNLQTFDFTSSESKSHENQQNQQQKLRLQTSQELNKQQQLTNKRPVNLQTFDFTSSESKSQENQQNQQNQQQNQQKQHMRQSSEEWNQRNLQLTLKRKVNRQSLDLTSSQSDSQENSHSIVPRNVHNAARQVALRNNVPNYGDLVSWKGINFAAGPDNDITQKDIENVFGAAYNTINHIGDDNQKIFHEALEAVVKTDNEDARLNATQLLQKNKYEVEEHIVKTDDGYFLTLFRIPSKDQFSKKPVVFLMHGLLGSADDWLLMGPQKSLAYLLADAGYEVWLGNARGSKYSRRHVSKHPAQPDFWQFSNDEIALYDLPAMIDYVLMTSQQEKMYYVGISQGTTAFFALAASHPEYNDKIIMMYALSPMVYMTNVRSPMLRMIAPASPFQKYLHKVLGKGQFKPAKEIIHTLGGEMCENEIGCKNVCSNMNFVMAGANVESLDIEMIPVIMNHVPAGASTRQIKQYAQGVGSNDFAKYDFGAETNERVYGSQNPPKYDMQMVNAPVTLYFSEEDWLAHPSDVQKLEKQLRNVQESYKIPVEHFSHMDFQFSHEAPSVVYKRLIDSIKQQEVNNPTLYENSMMDVKVPSEFYNNIYQSLLKGVYHF